jgi:hypothetical protein
MTVTACPIARFDGFQYRSEKAAALYAQFARNGGNAVAQDGFYAGNFFRRHD